MVFDRFCPWASASWAKIRKWSEPLIRSSLKWAAIFALVATSLSPAQAERRGGFFSTLFGGGQQSRTAARQSSAQRHANQAVQTALNFFGFDAGTIDGVLGRRSRNAIKSFQTLLEYAPTGQLTTAQRQFLLSAHEQASQPNEALQLQLSMGLLTYADLLLTLKQGQPVSAALTDVTSGPRSQRALCVNIQASGPLDLVKAQFCNLRQLAMEHSDFLLETALNAQIQAPIIVGCQSLTTEMRPRFARLFEKTAEDALTEIALLAGGQTGDEKLARQAETCLGLAYKHDDSEAALAALLLLAGLQDPVYIEQAAYHIAFGLGPEGRDPALASTWVKAALARLPESSEAVVSLTAQTAGQRGKILTDVAAILQAYP